MKKDLPYLLIILLSVILLYFGLLFSPDKQLYPAKDWWSQHNFWKTFEKESFEKDGEIPLWNPSIFSGAPFLGHPAGSTYFYPLNILFLLNNSNSVFKFYLLFHSLLAGISFFYLIKFLLGDKVVALFGSIAFIYGGAWISKISYGQLTNMEVVAYVPLLFLILIQLWRNPKWTLSLILGLVWGLQFCAGNQHLFYVSALSMGFLILYLTIEEILREKSIKKIIRKYMLLFLAAFITMGISAGQLLPSLEAAAWSIRTLSNYEYCTSVSLPIWQMISFLYPNIFGTQIEGNYIGAENFTELYGYAGLFPLLFALYYLFVKKNKDGYPFLMLAVLSLFLSFGKYTPIYKIFYKLIPGLNLFRIPATFLYIYIFALLILSCYGMKRFLDNEDNRKRRCFSILLITSTVFTIIIIIFHPLDWMIKSIKPNLYSTAVSESITNAAIHTLVLFIVFCVFYFINIEKKTTSFLLIAFLMADLLFVAYPLLKTREIGKQNEQYSWLNEISEDNSYFRIYDMKQIPQEVALRYNLQKITGLDPIILKHYFHFTNLLFDNHIKTTTEQLPIAGLKSNNLKNLIILDLLNVKYVISNQRLDSYKNLIIKNEYLDKERNRIFVYKNASMMPRAWLVHEIEEIRDFEAFRQKFQGFNPALKAYVSIGTAQKIAPSILKNIKENDVSTLIENVKIKDYKSNRILISIEAQKAGLLVVSEVWMPGWIAKVNGKATPVIRTDYVLRGIPIEKGRSFVELKYIPKTFTAGVLITFVFSVLVLILLITVAVSKIMTLMRPYAKKKLLEKAEKYMNDGRGI